MPRTIVRTIARDLRPLSTGVTTGAHGQNRFAFKQSLQARTLDFYRIDGCHPACSASPAEAG